MTKSITTLMVFLSFSLMMAQRCCSALQGELQKCSLVNSCHTAMFRFSDLGIHQHSVTPSWPQVGLLLMQDKLMLALCLFIHALAQRWTLLEICLFGANSMLINRMEVMS